MRLRALTGVAIVAALVPVAYATATPPEAGQGTVDRRGRAMTWSVEYRLPDPAPAPGPTATTGTTPVTTTPVTVATPAAVSVRWVAYAGPRTATRLRRVAAGQLTLAVRDGVVRFSRRVPTRVAAPMSGGFCAEYDLPGPGHAAATGTCPSAPTASRDELPARVPEVTVIGDSVGTGLDYVAGGRAAATGPWSAVFDLKVCRRLVAPPCPPNPPSALSVIRSMPGSLGDVAVIHVGYNDWGAVYDIGRVMAALKARGVRRAVWVNLQSIAPASAGVNAVIRRAAGRYDWLQVADWSARSAGQGWFVADNDHLTPSGAYALAAFYRAETAKAIRALRTDAAATAAAAGQPAR